MQEINDVLAYVEKLLSEGSNVIIAKKYVSVRARRGKLGEWITTWNVDTNGNPIVEKRSQVASDVKTGEASWILTKVDKKGQPIVDINGNKNEWIIEDHIFHEKYEEDKENLGIYKPIAGLQKFVKVPEAVTISHWGGKMVVDAGGYINITNPMDVTALYQK